MCLLSEVTAAYLRDAVDLAVADPGAYRRRRGLPAQSYQDDAAPLPPDATGHLTPRQAEIVALVRAGRSHTSIARELGVTLSTVRNTMRGARQSLGLPRRQRVRPAPTALSLVVPLETL